MRLIFVGGMAVLAAVVAAGCSQDGNPAGVGQSPGDEGGQDGGGAGAGDGAGAVGTAGAASRAGGAAGAAGSAADYSVECPGGDLGLGDTLVAACTTEGATCGYNAIEHCATAGAQGKNQRFDCICHDGGWFCRLEYQSTAACPCYPSGECK